MTTPNTTGPSGEIKRYELYCEATTKGFFVGPEATDGDGRFVMYDDHLAAIARAREDARRQALEEAAHAVMATGRIVTDGLVRLGRMEQGYAQARRDCYDAIHSLLTPTPQGETKEKS